MDDASGRIWANGLGCYGEADMGGTEYIRADIARAEAERAALEAKTEMAALLGITCYRDPVTGEPLMWGDADGDCLSPEIAVQCALEKIKRDALAEVQQLRDERDAFKAGLAAANEIALNAIAEADDLRARLAAAEAQVGALRLQLDQKDALYDSGFQAGVKLGWNFGVSGDEAGFQAATSSTEHVAELKRIRAALAAVQADAPTEYERKVAQMKEDFPNGI